MHDPDQWEFYGMFACLLLECDAEHETAERMAIEAEGEGQEENFEEGEIQMYQWLFQQRRKGLYEKKPTRPVFNYSGSWPLTLH